MTTFVVCFFAAIGLISVIAVCVSYGLYWWGKIIDEETERERA